MSIKDVISPFYAWKRAFEKPYTINKPLDEREGSAGYRGFHQNDIDKCIGCGSCEEVCQNAAIDMVEVAGSEPQKGDSGLRPKVDYGRCCWCSLCIDICPTESLTMSNEYTWISDNPDDYRYIPGIEQKKWDKTPKGYRRGEESWLVNPERVQIPELTPEERKTHFKEMVLGYDKEQALIEASRCLDCGLCVESCPTHMDIPQYIRSIREDDLDEGLRIMFDTNPMVEACGRICTARCEDACAVGVNGKPIAIRWLKRYIADQTRDRKEEILGFSQTEKTGKKVGIIGGGPAGLTAAFYLRQYGHGVTIYDKQSHLGGMLKYGIPDYRLPADALKRETDFIIGQDVEIKLNTRVGKDILLSEIHKSHDAVFISVGAQVGTEMPIEGLNTEGVYSGVSFLQKLAEGNPPEIGKSVVVVGGGNTAMDACRSSIRLGADVRVLYRRTEAEMPANREEIIEAKEEGVDIRILTSPTRIWKDKNGLKIECIKMELGEPDPSGRRRPQPIQGSEFEVAADTCIMAVGQKVDAHLDEKLEMNLTRWGTFEVDQLNLHTDQISVFAGGDCETGPDDAIKAIAAGKKAAYYIHKHLIKPS